MAYFWLWKRYDICQDHSSPHPGSIHSLIIFQEWIYYNRSSHQNIHKNHSIDQKWQITPQFINYMQQHCTLSARRVAQPFLSPNQLCTWTKCSMLIPDYIGGLLTQCLSLQKGRRFNMCADPLYDSCCILHNQCEGREEHSCFSTTLTDVTNDSGQCCFNIITTTSD